MAIGDDGYKKKGLGRCGVCALVGKSEMEVLGE